MMKNIFLILTAFALFACSKEGPVADDTPLDLKTKMPYDYNCSGMAQTLTIPVDFPDGTPWAFVLPTGIIGKTKSTII